LSRLKMPCFASSPSGLGERQRRIVTGHGLDRRRVGAGLADVPVRGPSPARVARIARQRDYFVRMRSQYGVR
jgi:hypothetical protein